MSKYSEFCVTNSKSEKRMFQFYVQTRFYKTYLRDLKKFEKKKNHFLIIKTHLNSKDFQ